jgi:ureidoacrylate peracid hydrolase
MNQLVTVDARPGPFSFDPHRTAVIVVDMQNDFGHERGMFARAGIDIGGINAVVPPISRVLEEARRAGIFVVYLKMEFKPDLSNAGWPNTPNWDRHRRLRVGEPIEAPDGSESRILIENQWGTDIVSELTPLPGDIAVSKHRYSGFFGTDLDAILKKRDIKSLIFTGCTTSVCVESTLRDAFFRDYQCLLLSDCTAEPIGNDLARTNHEATLLVVEFQFGWVSESAVLLRTLSGHLAVAAV